MGNFLEKMNSALMKGENISVCLNMNFDKSPYSPKNIDNTEGEANISIRVL